MRGKGVLTNWYWYVEDLERRDTHSPYLRFFFRFSTAASLHALNRSCLEAILYNAWWMGINNYSQKLSQPTDFVFQNLSSFSIFRDASDFVGGIYRKNIEITSRNLPNQKRSVVSFFEGLSLISVHFRQNLKNLWFTGTGRHRWQGNGTLGHGPAERPAVLWPWPLAMHVYVDYKYVFATYIVCVCFKSCEF